MWKKSNVLKSYWIARSSLRVKTVFGSGNVKSPFISETSLDLSEGISVQQPMFCVQSAFQCKTRCLKVDVST